MDFSWICYLFVCVMLSYFDWLIFETEWKTSTTCSKRLLARNMRYAQQKTNAHAHTRPRIAHVERQKIEIEHIWLKQNKQVSR